MSNKPLLNKPQQEARDHIDGPLVVLAGAGSGKTRVVVERISHLLNLGVPSSDILALTFTNKAANEMRERLKAKELIPPLTVTFHALGVKILRESIHHFGYQNDFLIFDTSDSTSLISQIIFEITDKKDKKVTSEIKQLISHAKTKLLLPADRMKELFFETEAQKSLFLEVYRIYNERLKMANAVDFDDLILLTVFILKDETLKEKYAARWKYILVDEYQDTNQAQYLICKALCSKHGNLFVVGDPDQSIYSWRGAKISNILNFESDFPGAKVISLQQNYRSTGHILSAANHVIEKNSRLYEKRLFSDQGDGEKVGVHAFSNGYEEVRFVVRKIKEFLKSGIKPSEIVIFYRTNSQSRMFEDGLIENGIGYKIIGGFSFYQRREVKDLLSYLRSLVSPFDPVSFSRVINLPKRGIGEKTLEKVLKESVTLEISIIDMVKVLLSGKGPFKLTAKAQEGFGSFMNFYNKISEMIIKGVSIAELIVQVFEHSNYRLVLSEEKDTMHDRLENIDELISKADAYDKQKEGTLQKFLEDVCLDVEHTKDDGIEEKISLMTIHNAKGLEFTCCFIVGLEEDVFPHIRSINSLEQVEEERRLFYVGMTRAKRILHITLAKRRFLWGAEKIMKASRFIGELPKEHILGENGMVTPQVSSEEASIGSTVSHQTFGRGTVEKIYETSYGKTYDIIFERDHQKRTLVARYAKLTLIG